MSLCEPGTEISPEACPTVSAEALRAYADASGDFNPIHLDPEIARQAGLPGVIAHGMLVAAWIAERALRFVAAQGPSDWEMSNFSSRFRAMVLLGDTVSISGTVKESSAETCVLELQARNQRGELTTTGTARFARKP